MAARKAKLERETGETRISVELDVDGTGAYEIDTGNGMFDHMLAQLSRHGLIDLKLKARGDIEVGWHHLVEDTGIVLGRTLHEAVGDGAGIMRMASFHVPLDEALALVVVDFGGRGYAVIDADIGDSDMGDLPAHLVRHFWRRWRTRGASTCTSACWPAIATTTRPRPSSRHWPGRCERRSPPSPASRAASPAPRAQSGRGTTVGRRGCSISRRDADPEPRGVSPHRQVKRRAESSTRHRRTNIAIVL